MSLSTQDGIYTWQKVAKAIVNASPANQAAFRDLKNYLVTQGKNPQLQFIPFTAEQIVTNTGFQAADVACTVYGVYGVGRRTTGTTASYFALHAAADNAATTTTIFTTRLKVTGQSFATVFPTGLACETGLTPSAATTVGRPTESSAADAAARLL